MSRRPLDPRRSGIVIDANALDRDGTSRDALIDRLLALQHRGQISITLPRGVREEALHTRTPRYVRDEIFSKIFTIPRGLTEQELQQRRRIEAVLQSNSMPGKHRADAADLFEAAKCGGGYFVTNDSRVLNKAGELAAVLPPTLKIVTLEQLLEMFDDYESGRRV